ncbi:MAG: hypothetical protein AB7T49_00745 [Oligoflexales bacterium]
MKKLLFGMIILAATQCSKTSKNDKKDIADDTLACTEIGCTDGFQIALEPTASWQAGKYKFTMTHDGSTTTCEGELPLKPCGTPSLTCTSDDFSIGESGCALPAANQGFSEISSINAYKSLEVQIAYEDAIVASKTFAFEYKEVFPNGPECPGQCMQAPAQSLSW